MGMQKYRDGFTVIEVMLFLAVSSVLAMAVLGSSTVGINNQRYIDAVNSFKALVQEEFINTTNVVNDRQTDTELCNAPNVPVGASDCIVMGRLLTVDVNGVVTRANLIGRQDSVPASDSDADAIRSYGPKIDIASQQTATMNWGTTIQKGGATQPVSIVIFRSPSSNNVLAYVKYGIALTQPELETFIVDTNAFVNNQDRIVCIDSSGWTLSQMQAVIITSRAAGPSGVEQRSVEVSECN